MRKKLLTILVVFSFLNVASFAFLFLPTTASVTPNIVYEPMDIGSSIMDLEVDFDAELTFKGTPGNFGLKGSSVEGDIMTWIWYDGYYGGIYTTDYELRGVGEQCELWVCTWLEWNDTDDPRAVPVVTDEQVDYMIGEFDNNIYETCSNYFGYSDFHDGSNALFGAWGLGDYYDPDGKTVILVSNIGDENFYDSTYPYYIAGFYWGSVFERYVDRNVISIDAYAWELRIGPQDPPVDGSRPYLYEGVFAHEYQHLLHADAFDLIADATFMNEGCSMFSEILCEYSLPFGDINSFFATPDNSLTEWGDQGGINILADYGQAFLWATFLVDYVSPDTRDFLKAYMEAGGTPLVFDHLPGIDLLDYMIKQYEPTWSYESIFKQWTLSNLLPNHPGYTSVDWDHPDMGEGVRIYENDDKWPQGITGISYGTTITILGYDTGIDTLGAYGTDYILLTKLKWQYFSKLEFNGLTDVLYSEMWIQEDVDEDGELEWYTGDPGPYSDISLVAEVDLGHVTTSAELSFTTYFEIEYDWDFGFVQVSTDNGETWISLENAYTTEHHDAGAMPEIVSQLPGFSGALPGVVDPMTFSLNDYLFNDLLIRFRYMTDELFQEFGWWIDDVNVVIGGNGEFIPIEDFGPAWETVDYFVHVIRVDYWRNQPYYTYIKEMSLDAENEGQIWLNPFTFKFPGKHCSKSPDVLLVISSTHSNTDYEFSVNKYWKHRPWMWCC